MSDRPRRNFITRQVAKVNVPSGLAGNSTSFGFIVRIDGQAFHWLWQWSGKYGKYDLQIVRSDDVRVLRRSIYTDDPGVAIRNWNLTNPERADAFVSVIDVTGERRPLLPTDLGATHHPFVFLGEVVRA